MNEPRNKDRDQAGSTPPLVDLDANMDATFQRRVIKQIRENLGGRLSSFDVKVAGREVQILAKPTRFWQRWGVKNDLQSLPVLKGYRASVELVD